MSEGKDAAQLQIKENKMGTMPVNRLLLGMATPMVISMLVQAFYNIVDSIYVSRIDGFGEEALAAVGFAFPIQMLIMAVANGTAVGVNSLLSRALGEKDSNTVVKAAHNGIFLFAVSALFFFVVGLLFAPSLIRMQGATGVTLEFGSQYLTIVCLLCFGFYGQILFERLLQSTGLMVYAMITQMTGAIINIIMDPILIYGWFGVPELKVAGAAVATIFGQSVACVLAVIFNIRKNKDVHLNIKNIRPDGTIIRKIYAVGIPSIIMQSIGSIMNFAMNKILAGLDAGAVAVFTVYYKLQSLFFMPTFGINNGMVPIVAYNYGAVKRSRIIKTIKLSMAYAFGALLLGFALFELIPDKLIKIFDTGTDTLYTLGVPALRIIAFHFLAAWFCIITLSVFQALGNGVYSLIVSVGRQLVILVPVAYILAKIGGLPLVWWSFPIAEVMSVVLSVAFLMRINRKIISQIPDRV